MNVTVFVAKKTRDFRIGIPMNGSMRSQFEMVGTGGGLGEVERLEFAPPCDARRFSCVRVGHAPGGEGSGAVIAAGTHSGPTNSVSLWNASVAGM